MRTLLLNTLITGIASLFMMSPLGAYAREFGTFHHFDTRNGLSSNYVTDIVQDKRGVLWIASDAGINRFDGVNFKSFSLRLDSIGANTVSSILYDDRSDCLWVGTRTGLGRLDCRSGEFTEVKLPGHAWTSNISKIITASDGGVWIISHYYNIIHIDKSNNAAIYSSKDIPGLISSFTAAVDDGRGHLIVGNEYGGFSVLNIDSHKAVQYGFGDKVSQISDMIVDKRGNVWFSGNHGITLFRPSTGTFHFFDRATGNKNPSRDRIFSLAEDRDGMILAGGDLGFVSVFDPSKVVADNPETLVMTKHNVRDPEISTGNIKKIFEDSFGNLWFCNYGKGLDVLTHTESLFTRLPYLEPHDSGFDNHDIWSVYANYKGEILLGGTNSIGFFDKGSIQKTILFPPLLSHKYSRVSTLGTFRDDILIGFYDDGLMKYDTRDGSVTRMHMNSDNLGINVFFPSGDSILIGSSSGIKIYKDDVISDLKPINKILNGLSTTGIYKDSSGNLWVGTYGAGVFVFDSTHKKTMHIDAGKLHGGTVKQLYADSRGWIWIVTKECLGVVRMSSGKPAFSIIEYPGNSAPTILRGITEDNWGNMWISTDYGLLEWEQSNGKILTFKAASDNTFSNFNDRAIGVDAYGRIILGSGDGAWMFNPANIHTMSKTGKVSIVECVAMNSQTDSESPAIHLPESGSMNTSHDKSSFQIVFAVPDVTHSNDIEYSVMMEGFDSEWSEPAHDNYVIYRKLPPGKYNFRVKARLSHQEWDEDNTASLRIVVDPPFWKTWWAILLYAAVIAVAVILWVRYYRNRIKLQGRKEIERQNEANERKLNGERLRFYTNITHELRTPLTLILGPLEDLLADTSMPIKYKTRINIIYTSAQRLLNLVNQILEFRKVETQNRRLCVSKGNLGNVITELGLRFKELYHNNKVHVSIDVEDNGEEIYFDQDIVTSIVSNFLSNAMKYTQQGTIRLSLKNVEQTGIRYSEISVEDTGYGISPEVLPHIFDRYYQAKGKHQASGTGIGLALVKSLAEVHGGTLSVDSTVGKGSVFRFRLLSDCIYPDALHSGIDQTKKEDEKNFCNDVNDRPLILIVEDNSDIRDYIIESLSDTFRIIGASNGREGYDMAITNNPDIIVSDLMMPVMDGLQMLKKIKGDVSTSHIPVILLTAKDSMTDKKIGYENGADSYLTKPFSAKLLKSRIDNILSARKSLVTLLTSKAAGKQIDENAAHELADVSVAKLGRCDREFIDRFTKLIEDNITRTNLDMAFIQENLNMSRSTLYRKIKGITGISGNEFIRKVKLRHALGMLREGFNVSDASYASGFNDVAYFRDCFKEEYGDSPTIYLKKLKQAESNANQAPSNVEP